MAGNTTTHPVLATILGACALPPVPMDVPVKPALPFGTAAAGTLGRARRIPRS